MKTVNIMKSAFGWNWWTWSRILVKSSTFNNVTNRSDLKILEIGAGSFSAVSLIFALKNDLTIGYFEKEDIEPLNNRIKSHGQSNRINLCFVDAFNVKGNYDLIILKSVLGGLFRKNKSTNQDVRDYISYLVKNHLNENGFLFTLDNGISFVEDIITNFGARKNNWRFFKPTDFEKYHEQHSIGFLTAFSFGTRFGFLGQIMDNFLDRLDILFERLFTSNPTVILTVYKFSKK